MKVLGIVAEYNPFHNGHLHHLKTARASFNPDCVVVVMSGNFTQRGEPAVADKWARAEIALLCGADLVIELPCVYAMASAEYFAFGAVKILDSLGVVNVLCFGSESGSLSDLDKVAEILILEPDEYKSALKSYLSSGNSFPAARQAALSDYFKINGQPDLSDLLKSSNNILGIEYLKALKRLNSPIVPATFERIGNQYNSTEISGQLSSATSIRKAIYENSWRCAREMIIDTVPSQTLSVLYREYELGRFPVTPMHFENILLSRLRSMSVEEISQLPYMEEGLENRLKQAAESSGSFEELVNAVSTRRYPVTRIQRILFCLLTGLKKSTFDSFNLNGGPAYIRVLGFNETGRKLLSEIRDVSSLPIITKAADFKNSKLPGVSEMLQIESAATDQYVLGYGNPSFRTSGSEFTRNILYKSLF